MDNYWYEFWVTYYDDMDNTDKVDHGIVYGTTMTSVIESLEGFYGEANITEVQIRMLSTWENAPLLFEKGCEANRARYWKKQDFEKNYE